MTDTVNTLQIFHINVNCSDFDRSLAFYQAIGFRPLVDFEEAPAGRRRTFGDKGLGPVLALPDDCDGRAALLALGDDPRATRLDLIEWRRPDSAPNPRRDLAQLGFARLCLKVKNCRLLFDALAAAGHRPYSPPTQIELAGSHALVFCCEDPDGAVIEFMQFLPAAL